MYMHEKTRLRCQPSSATSGWHRSFEARLLAVVLYRDATPIVRILTDASGGCQPPVRSGATLRVFTATGDQFDATYVLPRDGWRYLKKEGADETTALKFFCLMVLNLNEFVYVE